MSNRRLVLSIETISVAVVIIIMFMAAARSGPAIAFYEAGAEYVDLR